MNTRYAAPDRSAGFIRGAFRSTWRLLQIALVLFLIGYLAWKGWQEFGPKKPVLNPLRRELAETVLPRVVADLRLQRTNAATAVLVHFAGDSSDYLTDRLRQLLTDSGVIELSPPQLDETLQARLGLAVTSPATLPAAVARARGLGPTAVLFGTVHQFDGTPGGGRLALELTLADIATRTVLFNRTYEQEWKPALLDPALTSAPLAQGSVVSRLLIWTLAVLLLPVFSIGFLRATVRRQSNGANLGVLTVYTGVATVLAALLFGLPSGPGPVLLLLLLAASALLYQVWIMTFALRLERP